MPRSLRSATVATVAFTTLSVAVWPSGAPAAPSGARGRKSTTTTTVPATTTTTTTTAPSPTTTTTLPAPSSADAGFVTRAGSQLLLAGSPYRFTGLNIYNANSRDNCWYSLGTGTGLESSLVSIGAGKEAFRSWFFQHLATRDGQRDWTAFDHTLAVARTQGVKVIPTLVNQWSDCEGWASAGEGYKAESWYQSGYRTLPSSPGAPSTYRDWVREVVTRYKDDPTILAWQLVNEAEAKLSLDGSCTTTAAASLRQFTSDMAALVKSIDARHLLSLGTIGGGQCGAAGDEYKQLHAVSGVDLCEYHDYSTSTVPGDQWNGLAVRVQQCNELDKPLFLGETGIVPSEVGGTLDARAQLFHDKLDAQFRSGVSGILAWNWRDGAHGGSSLTNYDIGPSDPALAVLGRF